MLINFNSLHIEGFMSIGEADIDFTPGGFTLVKGINRCPQDMAKSNGSGKSSIWESIIWCLTGETIRGSKAVENMNRPGGTLVTVDFTVDKDSYIVTRTKNHSQYKTNLFITVNGKDCSGKGIRDTEKILKDYLVDLDASLISSVIILGQGLPAKFTSNSPSGRKEMLERMSKSDYMIQDLKTRVSNRRSEVENMKRDAEDAHLKVLTTLTNTQRSINDVDGQLLNLEDITLQKEKADSLCEEQKAIVEEISALGQDATKNDIAELRSEIDKQTIFYESKINGAFEEDERISDVKIKLNSMNNAVAFLREEIQSLKAIRDVCPTCGQKLLGVVKPDTSAKEKSLKELSDNSVALSIELKELEQARSNKVMQLKDERNKVIGGLNEKAAELMQRAKSIEKQLRYKKEQYTFNEMEYKRISESILKHDSVKSVLEETKSKYELQIPLLLESKKSFEIKIEELSESVKVLQKFDTVLKRDFRGILLKNVVDYINNSVNEYGKYIFDSASISFSIESNNISIKLNNKEYEMLSGGEKQKVDVIVQFAIRDMLCAYLGFDCNLLVLDEIFDNIDSLGCDKVIQLITTKLTGVNSIYIISHHAEELDIPVDNYLFVEKDSTGVSFVR